MDQHRFLKAILLRMLSGGLAVLTETYAFSLFLSSYSKDKIPYLYFSLAIIGFFTMQFSRKYFDHYFSKFLLNTGLVLLSFLGIFIFLSGHSYAWFPFFATVFIMTVWAMMATTTNIALMSLFSFREFKTVNLWLNFSGSVVMILVGFLITILLKYFSLSVLLYAMIAFLVALIVVNQTIRVSPAPSLRLPALKVKFAQNPLFILTFASSIVVLIIFTIADYSMKSELSHRFNSNEIGGFLGPFTAISNVAVILAQIFLAPIVLRRSGVLGLILATPIVLIGASFAMMVYPNLWTATFLLGLGLVCRISFYSAGFQMLTNVYAPAVTKIVQFQMQSFGRLGLGIAAILLIILVWVGELQVMGLAIIFSSIAMILICLKIGKYYFETLKTGVNLHRFNIDYLESENMDAEVMAKIANQALASEKEDVIIFGFSLLRKMKSPKIPPVVFEKLSSKSETLKKMAIQLVEASEDSTGVPELMRQLSVEKNPDLIWALVKAILHFSPDYLLSYSENAILSEIPAIKASGILVFLTAGNPIKYKQAKEEFLNMLNNEDSHYRYWAVNILKVGSFKEFKDYILKLANDSNFKVHESAIYAARFYPDDQIIALLFEKFAVKNLAHLVTNSLVRMGPRVIPKLLSHLQGLQNPRQIQLAMNLLSKFKEPEAENALIEFLKSGRISFLEASAFSLAYRTKQFGISEKARSFIYHLAFNQAEKIKVLRGLSTSYHEPIIVAEFQSSIFYEKKLFLYFLACCVNAKSILQIIPTLLMGNKNSHAYDSALELLEWCIVDQRLRDLIPKVLEGDSQPVQLASGSEKSLGAWLIRVLNYSAARKNGEAADPFMEMVFLLRKVPLFAKLSAELLQNIAKLVQIKNLRMGDILFKEGDPADGCYMVLKGLVCINKNADLINICSEGQFFGELALVDEAPRFAGAIAKEDSQLIFIGKEDFNRLADEVFPEILKEVTQAIVTYLRQRQI